MTWQDSLKHEASSPTSSSQGRLKFEGGGQKIGQNSRTRLIRKKGYGYKPRLLNWVSSLSIALRVMEKWRVLLWGVIQATQSSLSLIDPWSVAPAKTLKEESNLTVVPHIMVLAIVQLFSHIHFSPFHGHVWKGMVSHPFRDSVLASGP